MELEESTSLIQSYSQDSMILVQRQKYRSMEQNRKPKDKSVHLGHLIFDKGAKICDGEETISLASGAGKTGQLLVKE